MTNQPGEPHETSSRCDSPTRHFRNFRFAGIREGKLRCRLQNAHGQNVDLCRKMSGYELADVVRKSLDAYNSCKAGDDFSPHGVWDKIIADMQAKSGK